MDQFSFDCRIAEWYVVDMIDNPDHAIRRFGFGQRGADPVPTAVQDWLVSQLDAPDPLLARDGPSFLKVTLVDQRYQDARKAGATTYFGFADLFAQDMTALLRNATTTDLPFRERLVWFWSNHFTVSARAGNWPFGLVGAYVQEAIRPHVTGRFADLLKAVMRHPAMLYYLDNDSSTGPDSLTGLKQHLGINENLARECLELHTLGVESGYTQHDVIAFAAILSGRGVNRDGNPPGFVFHADRHEPGPKTLMGRTFPEGFAGSEAALDWLANHPATHRHLATQLVQQFVADIPPPQCVAKVAATLQDTGGDLKQAMLTIIALREAWQPLTKFRAPAEYVVAVQRGLDLPFEPGHHLLDATKDLGQPFMGPMLPNGWPDTAPDWLSGEALLKRADWAMTQACRTGSPTADAVMTATLGDLCSSATRSAVARCPTPTEALATVFASPEFVRR
ncbi:DUF1800 domain-containing protein [Rhodopila sp.]|uniref:DUF1800 domain-containing protein n=1 Tax=Rhodopila sp. TaxID=2480087 RepID=UPI003D0EE833